MGLLVNYQNKYLRTVKQQPTAIFAKAGPDIVIFSICNAASIVRDDIYKFGFSLLTSTLYFQMDICIGLDIQ